MIEQPDPTGSLVLLWAVLLTPTAAITGLGMGLSALDASVAVLSYAVALAGATIDGSSSREPGPARPPRLTSRPPFLAGPPAGSAQMHTPTAGSAAAATAPASAASRTP